MQFCVLLDLMKGYDNYKVVTLFFRLSKYFN